VTDVSGSNVTVSCLTLGDTYEISMIVKERNLNFTLEANAGFRIGRVRAIKQWQHALTSVTLHHSQRELKKHGRRMLYRYIYGKRETTHTMVERRGHSLANARQRLWVISSSLSAIDDQAVR
jgi:hypothetical protein